MSVVKQKTVFPWLVAAACGLGLGIFVACRRYNVNLRSLWDRNRNPLRHQRIRIVTNSKECRSALLEIRKDLVKSNVLGFDCEWVTVNGVRRPVALLQLASQSGLCTLFRLCAMPIDDELKELLEDVAVLKVGVAPLDDAKYLMKDYNVHVRSTLDLRHIAVLVDDEPQSLAKMAKACLGVELNKSWRIRCSSWDSPTLTAAQIDYAAKDCLVALEIFKTLSKKYDDRNPFSTATIFHELLSTFLDVHFKHKGPSGRPGPSSKKSTRTIVFNTQKRNLATRSKPLYDNCYMEAPDGEALCTMDKVKAQWYLNKGLATVICEDPLRMRLTFEPSGRAVGGPGQYDLVAKENRCVVCGTTENFSRKFIIPKEYRRFFPIVMKSHSSHDILLLCLDCHRTSHLQDNRLRERLAIECGAPLLCHLKKLKSYAQTLLSRNVEPVAREEMVQVILNFFPEKSKDSITDEFLSELTTLNTKSKAGDNTGHAKKVTEYFAENGGLLRLERLWRENFLETMEPRYLPDHWSTTHNALRLEVRASSLSEQEIKIVGMMQQQ